MTYDTLKNVLEEAQRFITVGRRAVARIKADNTVLITGSKETASVRRVSMDLTRALAEMRKTK